MSRPVTIQDTLTFNPTGYTGNSNLTAGTGDYVPSNGYHSYSGSASTSNSARWTTSSTSTVGYVYYTFNISGIPSNATITSVSCIAKIWLNNTSRVSNTTIRLYTGTTAKGSSSTFSTTSTSNTVTLNTGNSWTVSEVNNIRLRFGGQKASSNSNGYIYFYGADLSISYSFNGTEYEIISTLATDAVDSIDPAGQTWIVEGNDYELTINGDSVDGIKVLDNNVDVTDLLVYRQPESQGSVSKTADSFTTGFSGGSNMNFYTASGTTGNNFNYAVGHTAENPGTGSTVWTYVKENNGSTSNTGYADFVFDFSDIPVNASITGVDVKCYGAVESSGQSTSHADITLFSGNTQKGTMQKFTSSTNSIITINDPGTWTREELQSAKLRFAVGYYGGRIFGITWTVSYAVESANGYWTYAITSVSADHTIIVKDDIIEIPDEDPEYDYYPITISSINATTTPGKGTVRLVEGSNQTITIVPQDPSITLILDNGQDVSNRLVTVPGPQPTYTVSTAPGVSYGFTYNNSTEYYVSNNKGVDKSAAVCVVHFNLPVRSLVTIQYINYAEATYDFGIFGNIDVPLNGTYKPASGSMPDSNYKLACNTSSYNSSSVQTITYEIPSGEHDVYIKYSKDDATSSNNDTLQFKISDIQELEANNYYTYTLTNIQEQHSLIFIFGDVTYYFVNSSGTNARLFPAGQMVQLPGDTYRITIVPDDYSYSVSVSDNGVDVTSSVERKEEQITKEGVTTMVVNYIYTISNIQATHNIIVSCSASTSESLYIKISGAYVKVSKIWKKADDRWNEVTVNTLTEPAIFISKN